MTVVHGQGVAPDRVGVTDDAPVGGAGVIFRELRDAMDEWHNLFGIGRWMVGNSFQIASLVLIVVRT